MQHARLMGGSVPYQEAIRAKLKTVGVDVVDGADTEHDRSRTIVIGYCRDDSDWAALEALQGYSARTAVIERIELGLYVRALRSGIGVVHVNTRSETIVSVALAAGQGETVLPTEIARQLAEARHDSPPPPNDLDPLELDIVKSIARGETLVAIADRYFYSERTMRRRLQSAYIKLGAQDRAGAIRAADKLGLL